MVTKLKSHCDQASMKVLQGRKTSAVVCAREDRKRKALKCAVTGYTDLTSALGDYTGFDATPQVEAFTLVAAKKNRTEARTQRKRAPELIEEEEEGARRKERRIRDSSSSSSSDDDSESELEELLRVHEEEEHALEERRTQLDEDVAVLLAEADAETERSGGVHFWSTLRNEWVFHRLGCTCGCGAPTTAASARAPPPNNADATNAAPTTAPIAVAPSPNNADEEQTTSPVAVAPQFNEFDEDDEVLANMHLPAATESTQPQAEQWISFSDLDWGVDSSELGEDTDWQFKWGEELGQLMESYLCYEGEQTVQERTEHRTYYTSVTVRNSHTGALVLNCTTLTLASIR